MILDDKAITELTRKGVKLINSKGEPIRLKTTFTPPKKEDPEIEHLRRIESLLEQLLSKPTPELKSPNVIVNPPEVIVNTPEGKTFMPLPVKPITKWKFELIRGFQGLTTEIIATAME